MEFKVYDTLPEEAVKIREDVFILEQGFKNELDETDKIARHILLFVDNVPAAVCRIFTDDGKSWHIGRVAVVKEQRGKGLGKAIMAHAEDEIKRLGGTRAELSGQTRVADFYRGLGYTQVGEEYLDEYCPHVFFYKEL